MIIIKKHTSNEYVFSESRTVVRNPGSLSKRYVLTKKSNYPRLEQPNLKFIGHISCCVANSALTRIKFELDDPEDR